MLEIFVYVSAGLFWGLICLTIYSIFIRGRGLNDKIRTHEKVVTVLTNNQKEID